MASKQDYLEYAIKQINTAPHIADNFLNTENKEFNHRNAFHTLKSNVDDFLEGADENRFIVMPGLRGGWKKHIIASDIQILN